jgi:hypothetical protein
MKRPGRSLARRPLNTRSTADDRRTTLLGDVEAVLDLADERFLEIGALYQAALDAKSVPPRLQALIKGFLEHQRSALDYVAEAVNHAHGTKPGHKVYWPYAKLASEFTTRFDKNFPGVRSTRPDIATAWESFQPYNPGYAWIKHLMELTNENKHRALTPQVRTDTPRREHRTGKSVVSWDPRSVTFGPGVSIGGELVNVGTQTTASTRDLVYVDWLFSDPNASVIRVLTEIKSGVRPMLHELCSLSGL